MEPESSKTQRLEQILTDLVLATTGKNLTSFIANRQNDTSKVVASGVRIESGWGVIPVGTGGGTYDELVTFKDAFAGTPIVVLSFAGDNAAVGNDLAAAGNNIEGIVGSKVHSISTTGFHAYFYKPNGAAWGSAGYGYYTWIAIGA